MGDVETDAAPASAVCPWGGWDAATRDDPYPRFAAMRTAGPVHPVRLADGHDAWLVIGHDAARQALRDARLSKDMVAALDEDPDVADEGLPGPAFARHMLAVDGDDHARLRRLVARAFVPSRIAALEPAIERLAHELLDELEAAGPEATVDLIAGYAHPLPFRVICELLGVPVEDRDPLRRAFQTLFQPWHGSPPPEAVAASDTIVASLHRLVEVHRAHRPTTSSMCSSPRRTTTSGSTRPSCCRASTSSSWPVTTPPPA